MKHNSKHTRSLINNLSTKLLIVGGLLCSKVEVRGTEAVGRFVKGQQQQAQAINTFLEDLRRRPRNWQFWCATFYNDGEEQYFSSVLYEPMHGTSRDIDAHLTPMVDNFVKEGDDPNLCSYGWVAIPSDQVEIDEKAEDYFVRIFEAKNCYSKAHGQTMLLQHRLTKELQDSKGESQ